jgi:hypothetical protein
VQQIDVGATDGDDGNAQRQREQVKCGERCVFLQLRPVPIVGEQPLDDLLASLKKA